MNSASKVSPEIRSDGSEPQAAPAGVPVVLFIALGILFFWGLLYLDRQAGGFNPVVYYPYASTNALPPPPGGGDLAKGKTIYNNTCSPCHQANGLGLPGQFPPLAGSDWVVGMGPNRMIRIVLNGLQGPITVKGGEYNNAMVPWRDTLSDADIAAVLTYVRNEWGNKGDPVKPEQVKQIRAETADKSGSWTADELLQVPDK